MAEEAHEEEEREEEDEEQEEPKKKPKFKRPAKRAPSEEDEDESPYTDCDVCDLTVRKTRLDAHLWRAHKIRPSYMDDEDEDEDRDDEDSKQVKAPPKKQDTKKGAKKVPSEERPEATGVFGAWKR